MIRVVLMSAWSNLLSDLRAAVASCRRSKVVAAAAIGSIALGIGANTAVFSVTHALLLRPLPYPDPERLAILWNRSPGLDIAEDWFSTAQYFDIKTRHQGLEDVGIALGAYATVTGDGRDADRLGTIRLSTNVLTMLGARPLHGRLIGADDERVGAPNVAVLRHGTWMARHGGDPSIVGRSVELNGVATMIVGVFAPGFALPREVLPTLGVVEDGDLILPLRLPADAATIRTREDYNLVARLKRGVTFADAQAEMDVLTASLRAEYPHIYPPNGGLTFSLVPMQEQVAGRVRGAILLLTSAVVVVLLVACANVGNLLLARASGRAREMAARAALGASRARLMQQLLVESVALSLTGGALGAGLAWIGVQWLQALQPADVPRLADIGVNLPVLIFTAATATCAGVLFGIAPAWSLSRVDLQLALRHAGRGSSGASVWGRRHRLGRLLVVGEIALALMLLVGAGLLVRSFARVQEVPGGFDPSGVLTFEVSLTGPKYPDSAAVRTAYRELWERLDAVPGVTNAGGVTPLPLSNFFAWGPIQVEGRTPPVGERFINADQRIATPRYFDVLGIRLLDGRLFTEHDTQDSDRVVIVDDRMAELLWPGESAIGKRIRYGDETTTTPWETVVGVVERVRQYGLDADARIAFYRPHAQQVARTLYVALRTAGDPGLVAGPARDAVRAFDANLPVFRLKPMTARVEESLARRRFLTGLVTLFAAVAGLLAVIGVYGVMAYLVAQGTRELGIRLALGATPGGVRVLVLGRGLRLAAAGLALGAVASLLLTRLIEGLLFNTSPTDGAAFAWAATGLAILTLVACDLPARRAAAIDPVEALRRE